MKKYLLNLLLVSSLFAGTYDVYSVEQMEDINTTHIKDPFMDGVFVEIRRFDRLDFSNGSLTAESKDNLDAIVSTIKSYKENEKNILIQVIGHSELRTDRHNELVVESDTYANSIQNIFRETITEHEAEENSNTYASKILKKLQDSNISKDIISLQIRASKDLGFSTVTDKGINLSNRVMLTMYVIAPVDKDSDNDGVLDSIDECLNTPSGVQVDEKGCPFDSDKDGILDFKDACADTPLNVEVDERGCPFDSDNDGVLDYKDNCPDTISGVSVDVHGCPISKALRLNFEHKSSEIPENVYSVVKDFAAFLKANPAYNVKVIGHTDSVGKAGDNMVLSFDRAHAVKTALIQEGVQEKRIEALGRGELDPVETNRSADGRAMNRRIEVKLFN